MRRHVVVVNPKSGRGRDPRRTSRIRRALAAEDVRVELEDLDGRDARAVVRSLLRSPPDAVVVAGGDGTIGAAAGAVAGSGVPLGILPMGTANHFAKDLQLPLRLRAAARVLARGRPEAIDIGEVNGRAFVNNASIGLYPRLVRRREEQRVYLGRNKWYASAVAAAKVLRRNRRVRVRLRTRDGVVDSVTPFVFVGNNRYEFEGLRLGRRRSVNEGVLGVYLSEPLSRRRLVALPLRALTGRLRHAMDFQAFQARSLRVEAPRPRLDIALDGELHSMTTPLRFRSRMGALHVLRARRAGA